MVVVVVVVVVLYLKRKSLFRHIVIRDGLAGAGDPSPVCPESPQRGAAPEDLAIRYG